MTNNPDSFSELDLKMISLAISKAKEENQPLSIELICHLSQLNEDLILNNPKIVELLKHEGLELTRPIINPIVDKNQNIKILDLESLDIFDGFDDIDDINNIEIIEDIDLSSLNTENNFNDQENTLTANQSTQIDNSIDSVANDNTSSQSDNLSAESPKTNDNLDIATNNLSANDNQSTTVSLNKFVGGSKVPQANFNTNLIPAEIRKACIILGIDPNNITKEVVMSAWKKELTQGSLHPDLGGDTDSAKFLNTAKDALLQYIESLAPKLGKKFGKSQTKPQV